MRRLFGSVRARTTLVATTLTAVVLVLGSVAIVRLVEQDLVGAARSTLEEAYSTAQVQAGDDPDSRRMVTPVRVDDELLLFTYTLDEGAPGTAVEGFLLEPGESEPVAALTVEPDTGRVLSMRSFEGDELEGLAAAFGALPIDVDGDASAAAVVLSDTALEEVSESVDAVVAALLLIVPALVLILGLTIWLMVGRALRPVHAISAQVASISSSTLDERVPVPPSDDEIAELAVLMNQMLERVEQGSDRQRRFVADASHELRSPLSTIKAAADVALASEDPTRFRQLAGDVSEEADRMELLIADLLDLARLDEANAPPTSIAQLADVCRAAAARVSSERVVLELELEDAEVVGDAKQLERAVLNLVANAQRHATTRVRVSTGTTVQSAYVQVDDDGQGIAAPDRERVFQRFVRLDDSRTRSTGGAGIGLSLVQAVAERHRGSVEVSEAPGLGGARFRLQLPLAGDR